MRLYEVRLPVPQRFKDLAQGDVFIAACPPPMESTPGFGVEFIKVTDDVAMRLRESHFFVLDPDTEVFPPPQQGYQHGSFCFSTSPALPRSTARPS